MKTGTTIDLRRGVRACLRCSGVWIGLLCGGVLAARSAEMYVGGEGQWWWPLLAAMWAAAYASASARAVIARLVLDAVQHDLTVTASAARDTFRCSACGGPLRVVPGDTGRGWSLFCDRCAVVDVSVYLRRAGQAAPRDAP